MTVGKILRTGIAWIIGFCIAGAALYGSAVYYVLDHFEGDAVFPADCGIVFGAAVRPVFDRTGTIIYTGPGPGILRRVSTAAELYRAGKIKTLFLTGGKGEGMAESEASVMQRMAVVNGVKYEDTVVEGESHSTGENVRNTLPLMKDCRSIVGISDRYHLARIGVLAEKAGRSIQTYPSTLVATKAFEFWSVAREAIGILLIAGESLLT